MLDVRRRWKPSGRARGPLREEIDPGSRPWNEEGDTDAEVVHVGGGLDLPLAVIGGTLVANAGSSITSPESFTLVGSSHRIYADDQGERGPSPGDVLVFTQRLTDESDANVGKARGQCTVHAGRWEICTYAWTIAERGEIVAEGTYPPYAATDTPPFDFPVTGGTGDFSNVRGSVHVEVLDGAERFTFDLIP